MTPAGVGAVIFVVLVAVYCGTDPFKHSPISGFPDFETYRLELPDWSKVPTDRDAENLLQKSEIKFLNQVQGPESIAFDPLGRGPYTGVADGRVLFWDGHSWNDFAYTSPNRSATLSGFWALSSSLLTVCSLCVSYLVSSFVFAAFGLDPTESLFLSMTGENALGSVILAHGKKMKKHVEKKCCAYLGLVFVLILA